MWQEQTRPKRTAYKYAWLLNLLLARSGPVAYIPITFVTIAIFIGSSWQIFLPFTDPARYQCYALTFWLGSNATNLLPASQCAFLNLSSPQPAFHMLPLEYPPLTLLLFSLPLLVPLAYYQLAFAFLMSLTSFMIYALLLKYGPRGAALAFAIYLFIGGLGTAQIRFDLLPAALTLLCVMLAERRHWNASYVALAFAVLLKIYPLLLLPALFIAQQQAYGRIPLPKKPPRLKGLPLQLWYTVRVIRQWRWQNCLLCLGIIIGTTAFFALLNFQGAVINQLRYFADRPVQVEATGSTFLWLAQRFGIPFTIEYTYGSLNIVSALGNAVARLSTLAFALGSVYTLWLQWRGKLDVTQATIALLFVFIATGKVFSPQYLIWLMPLLAYAGAFDTFWTLTWGIVSLLTTFIFIYFYSYPVHHPEGVPLVPGFFEIVTTRNMFFLLATLAYLFCWFQARHARRFPGPPKAQRPDLYYRKSSQV